MSKYYSYIINREKTKRKISKIFKKEKEEQIKIIINDLVKEFDSIKQVILFGSFLSDHFSSSSDIDIYIENIPAEEYFDIRRRLEEFLMLDVDLYTQTDSKYFIERIKNRGEIIYERKD